MHVRRAVGTVGIVIAMMSLGCAKPQTVQKSVPKEVKLVDGVYEGSYTQLPNIATVRVTVENGRIAKVDIVSHLAWKGKKAEGPIAERIVRHQSTAVDGVTGATNSSQVLTKAAQIAIEKAYPKP